jgi:hypothetical protein
VLFNVSHREINFEPSYVLPVRATPDPDAPACRGDIQLCGLGIESDRRSPHTHVVSRSSPSLLIGCRISLSDRTRFI